MNPELVREGRNRYILRRRGNMCVEGIVYLNHHLLPLVREDKSLQQLANAACLPVWWAGVAACRTFMRVLACPSGSDGSSS